MLTSIEMSSLENRAGFPKRGSLSVPVIVSVMDTVIGPDISFFETMRSQSAGYGVVRMAKIFCFGEVRFAERSPLLPPLRRLIS